MDRPPDILVALSDEHTAAAAEWAGHRHVRTPHLDRLAAQSVSFDGAYTNSPMCELSRLSLIAGQYVHQIGAWDNGVIPSYRTPTTWTSGSTTVAVHHAVRRTGDARPTLTSLNKGRATTSTRSTT